MSRKKKAKIRKSTRYTQFIVAMILLAFSISDLIYLFQRESIKNAQREIYTYSNNFKYDYNVKLIKNSFFDKDNLEMDQSAYVTDLIDTINFNIKYDYIASSSSDINYKLKITGQITEIYTKDSEEEKILEKNEILKDEQNKVTSSNLNLNETLKLDLKSKNNFAKNFEQTVGVSLDAKYTITIQIDTDTMIENQNVTNHYETSISMDLGKKTTKIYGDNNKKDTQYITKQYQQKERVPIYMIAIDDILIMVAVCMLQVLSQTQNLNRTKNTYRQELNKILRICQDKIVKVRTKPIITENNLVEVKDLGEIIKLAEELYKPILFWEDQEHEEAWFTVMSNDMIYRYVLKG